MNKIKFRFDEKKLKKRGIAFLILDPIIFILLLKFTQQPYAYLYIAIRFLFGFTAYSIRFFKQAIYFYKGFIKQIFNYQEDEENNVFRRVQMGLFIEIIVLAYVILFAAKCYRPLLITDDIVSIIICNGLITLLFLLCSYRSEKKYRIFSEINGKYIN